MGELQPLTQGNLWWGSKEKENKSMDYKKKLYYKIKWLGEENRKIEHNETKKENVQSN